MTTRSSFASKRRPLSAIFLGPGPVPSTSELPDLPEPPSPGASSTHSGLPSPPATNSTGSGSTGDIRENLDRHSLPPSSAFIMRNEKLRNSQSSRASSSAGGGESKKDDDDEEEDNTARLNLGRRRGTSQSSDHVMTLQRVMSLTQRNRMALDKLSSMRLNTPSPSQSSHSSHSPNPAAGTSASAASSTRSRSVEPTVLSGSETEREPGASYSNSSDDQSVTPPSSVSHALSILEGRLRRTSLPASPSKGKAVSSTRSYSPGPPQRTPKKRVSILSMPDPDIRDEHDPHDVTSTALAAVASLRRSPGSGGRKNRQPLPREFRDSRRASSDGRTSKEPTTPQKLPRERYSSLASDTSPSRAFSRRIVPNQYSPHRSSQVNRSSTTRKHQLRWMSEDLRTTSARSIVDDNEDDDPLSPTSDLGNRQTVRGGSMENSLGTRLIGDSLRAAGMSIKSGGDVFRELDQLTGNSKTSRRHMSISTNLSQDRESVTSLNRTGVPSRAGMLHDPRTPANGTSHYRMERGTHSGPQSSRPSTSMADLPINGDILPPKTAPPGLRTYRSMYTLDRDREGIGSRQASHTPYTTAPQERTYGSPRPRSHETPALPLDEQAVEHIRLMDESLAMFEALLSRLPPMGDTTTATVPEVFRNAQSVVRFSEQVNVMLRAATNRALERLIDSEVSDAGSGDEVDMVGLWKDVGGDFRDMLRVSDELVRTTTGFLLGVGKVLRESSTAGAGMSAGTGAGSSLQHLRGASEDFYWRSGADGRSSTSAGTGTGSGKGSGKGSGSGEGVGGRRSTESRRSWDPARVERDRVDLVRRASSRLDTSVHSGQRTSSSMLLRDRDPLAGERTLNLAEDVSPAFTRQSVASSVRRSHTGGLQREGVRIPSSKPELATIESQKSLHIEDDYEPSPTPAPRSRQPLNENTRQLPPLSIPASLPALPSESHADQQASASTADKSVSRRKISTASTSTVRGGSSGNPGLNITTPSAAPTTAVTPHTVTPVPLPLPPAVSRAEPTQSSLSNGSSRQHSNTVTFSRPQTVSVSALSGLQQRDARSRSTSNEAPTPVTPLSATSPWTPRSGSETERPQPRLALGRRTLGPQSHLSLDAPSRGGAQTLARSTARERRRTITEIFSS
ncbi:hypothetical protein B0F90DRAFT_1817223 [Multifurca ochricompacta]|uniref:Uncharacterized protein n=1 Tax=Multifurca ochricompacta TaxID=376703 RepID=A0AAD4QNP2_9AGAM|nr:hypothetical protein B0F90DRAFT_1817223 [Multifurca ochricompacta]